MKAYPESNYQYNFFRDGLIQDMFSAKVCDVK